MLAFLPFESIGDHTSSPLAVLAVALFAIAYLGVVLEDVIHLRKSKPVLIAAGAIWVLTALVLAGDQELEGRVQHHIAEFAEIFLFLLVAMTYVNAIAERRLFVWLNSWLVSRGLGYRAIFWATGGIAFLLSPVADNMTTALVLGSVAVTVGGRNALFVAPACVNIVVAANAGGAFSPFGDITTLMVWKEHKATAMQFLELFPPALVNWLVPALVMSFFIPRDRPEPVRGDVQLAPGCLGVVALFLATIVTAVVFHSVLHLPAALGMMFGLGYYCAFGYIEQRRGRELEDGLGVDVLRNVAHVEWDTMLFFFGVILCVGGLQELGFLHLASESVYGGLGTFWANVAVGSLSAVIDNVPVMFAVLGMDPVMGKSEWLLVTLTAGVGGSMLSVGSAAGVALMGTARGSYTFASHLKWTPIVLLGYIASIGCHELVQHLLDSGPVPIAAKPF